MHHAKFQVLKLSLTGPPSPLKILSPPFEAKKIFGSIIGLMGIKWMVLTHWTQIWNLFLKICIQSWENCQKPSQNVYFDKIGKFCHFLAIFSGLDAYFQKRFSDLCSVSPDSSFDTHQPCIRAEKNWPQKGGLKQKGGPVKLNFKTWHFAWCILYVNGMGKCPWKIEFSKNWFFDSP